MPLPKPRTREKKGDFVDRCMGDDVMVEEYPDSGQRRAVCETQWEAKTMRSWYEIRAKAKDADIYIYDEIGIFGISASAFVRDLNATKTPRINLYINSPGGQIFDAIAIYNALERHPAKIHAEVDGLAASAASVIVQAGADRQMAKGSALMIHEAQGFSHGDSGEMEKTKEILDNASESLADIYAERAGGEAADWRKRMQAETWYTAQGAVDAGLADGVTVGGHKKAPTNVAPIIFNLAAFNNVPDWFEQKGQEAGREIEMDLADIRKALGIAEDADILDTIKALKDGDGEGETDDKPIRDALGIGAEDDVLEAIATLKGPPSEDGTDPAALKVSNSVLQKRVISLERKIEHEADLRRVENAEGRVNAAISEGRILPKLRKQALKLALADLQDFEAWVQTLPRGVKLGEIGTESSILEDDEGQINAAELQPTAAQLTAGKQMGLTREQIMVQNARDRGITLPEGYFKPKS